MLANQTSDTFNIKKLARVHALAGILLDLVVGNPEAQLLAELIMETSLLPEAH